MLGQCMASATEYLMVLATRQKQNLQNKGEMKNVDLQHLITEQNNRTRKKKIYKKDNKVKKKKEKKLKPIKTQNPTADF